MKRGLLLFILLFSLGTLFAANVPKAVAKGLQSVATVVTYKNGVLKASGNALFVGGGDLLASTGIFIGADSAVVIDSKGKARPVKYIVGINDVLECIRVRVAADKKIKPLVASASKVNVGDELYMLTYGVKGKGSAKEVKVLAADSLYGNPYYTLGMRMQEKYVSLPLLNSDGELVAVMQHASQGDTVSSYAVGLSVLESLVPTAMNYGRGYYDYARIGIRTALPGTKEDALSCLYMQAMAGDSLSWLNTLNDYMAAFPASHEGYLSLAEYSAVYCRDMKKADEAWKKAFSLTKDKADVYYGKGKVIASIVQSGDTVSHSMLSYGNALSALDKAIEASPLPLYVNYKADLLRSIKRVDEAIECYKAVKEVTPDVYASLSQCYVDKGCFDDAVAMLDSAVALCGESDKAASSYILARGAVKVTAERFREAVIDLNRYEELAGGMQDAAFYYMREQAELKCKMYQQALNDIETAIYIAPQTTLYYFEKGMLCYRVKLTDEGIRALEKARELAPAASDVHYLLGRLYVQRGDKELAKESFEIALELAHPDAAAQLENLK